MDCSLPGSPVHGILQARVLVWVAIAFSGYAVDTILMAESKDELKSFFFKKKLFLLYFALQYCIGFAIH